MSETEHKLLTEKERVILKPYSESTALGKTYTDSETNISPMVQLSREKLGVPMPLSVERWIREKGDRTKDGYLWYLDHFSQVSGLTPDSFLAYTKTAEPVQVLDLIQKTREGLTPGLRFNFEIAMRSFLKHNGYNDLPKSKIAYMNADWHRGFKREEVKNLLGFLDRKQEKLYVLLAIETGFRAKTILAIQYKHIAEDFEAGIIPCAVRLDPRFYGKAKSAGFSFLGERSVTLIREMVKEGLIKAKPESFLIEQSYTNVYRIIHRAIKKAGLDKKIQPNHGLRKYFEAALDKADIDTDKKHVIEGHFAGTRARHYTGREFDELRPLYQKAYPHIDIDSPGPEIESKLGNWQLEKIEFEKKLAEKDKEIRELKDQFKINALAQVSIREDFAALKRFVNNRLRKKG